MCFGVKRSHIRANTQKARKLESGRGGVKKMIVREIIVTQPGKGWLTGDVSQKAGGLRNLEQELTGHLSICAFWSLPLKSR
jgi:hypothetical protein